MKHFLELVYSKCNILEKMHTTKHKAIHVLIGVAFKNNPALTIIQIQPLVPTGEFTFF